MKKQRASRLKLAQIINRLEKSSLVKNYSPKTSFIKDFASLSKSIA